MTHDGSPLIAIGSRTPVIRLKGTGSRSPYRRGFELVPVVPSPRATLRLPCVAMTPWHPLPPSSISRGAPPLLVQHTFTGTAYAVDLTDLTYVWSEALARQDILNRAWLDETSIDPSGDPAQLLILLRTLEAALNGDAPATWSLHRRHEHDLSLDVTCPLPAPLKALQWSFALSRATPESLTRDVIRPLLTLQRAQSSLVERLLAHLKDKDHVIDKLVDKLDSSGMDLAMVFPGAAGLRSGGRPSSRVQAGQFIKGLDVFDVERWRHEDGATRGDLRSSEALAALTSDGVRGLRREAGGSEDSQRREQDRADGKLPVTHTLDDETTEDEDAVGDDPGARRPPPPSIPAEDVTEASRRSLDAGISKQPGRGKRIGKIGGRRTTPSVTHTKDPGERPHESPQSKGGKLGKVGGGSSGTLGVARTGDEVNRAQVPRMQDEVAGKEPTPPPPRPAKDDAPSETAEERALRKRKELKEQLVGTGQGATKKRKRMF
ncbi:MAG: hypothetical protein M1838_006181 [Thelocarpon superellum]|nr:MAG: hypothetical protein M1838_006181 [Thelocarpon superellum]